MRAAYAQIASGSAAGCGPVGCVADPAQTAALLGYSPDDDAPGNLGLGCGNPQAIAALQPGEVVLDLGSGAGFDAFLAARMVGDAGRVIGVDMTHEMLAQARANAVRAGLGNVTFRLGEIEALPVADQQVDVVISNCVVNLSPNKTAVYQEAFRVLKPGGRLAISDILAREVLMQNEHDDLALLVGCIAGAATVSEVESGLLAAGFVDVHIKPKAGTEALAELWAPGHPAANKVMSASIEARRP